jgi:hypothetical protein
MFLDHVSDIPMFRALNEAQGFSIYSPCVTLCADYADRIHFLWMKAARFEKADTSGAVR